MPSLPSGFFAYASLPPSIPQTIQSAILAINRSYIAQLTGWEEMSVNGRFINFEILEMIDAADLFCADITGINPNVMFELGYAIARDKRVWLIRDDSYTDARRDFEQLRLLTTVGYTNYSNSEHIAAAFSKERPYDGVSRTIYRQAILPELQTAATRESVLYLKSNHDTEASLRVTRALDSSPLDIVISDPKETNIQPLYWYAQRLQKAVGCVSHLASTNRTGSKVHNARYALISGLAAGFGVSLLMLSELQDVLAPLDYRDLLKHYTTPDEARSFCEAWLDPIVFSRGLEIQASAIQAKSLRLAGELKDFHLQLGDYVAENERRSLPDYFVETTVATDIVNGTQSIFVGRKGTGKTANLIFTQATLGKAPNNLVCLVKPPAYDIEALLKLFALYQEKDRKGYVIESLWKYMLYTELAHSAVAQMNKEALWSLNDTDARALVDLMEDSSRAFSGDFVVRLERITKALSAISEEKSTEALRKGVSEALHISALHKLKGVLAAVLTKKHRVLLLIDNLDKPWIVGADYGQLSEFLLGLITAAERVQFELDSSRKNSMAMQFNSAIFLRSDIFERMIAQTKEPDKLAFRRLQWDDPEVLLRVIEERYVASHGMNSDPAKMWHDYFCPDVNGIPTRYYLISRILARPRDIIFFVKAAVAFAVNRKHNRVEISDILDAEREYSQYALDSILVEGVISVDELEAVLFQFVGQRAVITEDETRKIVSKRIEVENTDAVVELLVKLSFLAVEVESGVFEFSDEPRQRAKQRVLSENYLTRSGEPRRFQIAAPFRAYLGIVEN